jgi:hypothetical protein
MTIQKLLPIVQLCAYVAVVVLSAVVILSILMGRSSPQKKNELAATPSATANSAVPASPQRQNLIGKSVPLQGIDWQSNGATLVMYISTGCHFCQESTPFYQKLSADNVRGKMKLIAVMPQSVDESTKYLQEHGIIVDQVMSASLRSIGVSSTPTLMIVSDKGIVSDFWRGKLDDSRQNEVLDRLTKGSTSSSQNVAQRTPLRILFQA